MSSLTFSVIVPIFNPNKKHLQECLNSIINQDLESDHFEIVLIHDYDGLPFENILSTDINELNNVKIIQSDSHLGISGATNLGASLAEGKYLVLVDQDDLIELNALTEILDFITSQVDAPDLMYSDYRLISENGKKLEVVRTPDHSPIRLLALMYAAHLKVISYRLWGELGGFKEEFDGAQDHDFFLRATSLTIPRHIPKVIYSWRASPTSSQSNSKAKPLAGQRSFDCINSNLGSTQLDHRIAIANWFPRLYLTDLISVKQQKLSIIIPSAFAEIDGEIALIKLLESIARTADLDYIEINVVYDSNRGLQQKSNAIYSRFSINWIDFHQDEFNFSKAVNYGVERANFEHLLILNDDTVFLTEPWTHILHGFLDHRDVGIVGAKLQYPNGDVQHAGIGILENGHCYHILHGTRNEIGHLGEGVINHEVDAVTGAFMGITKENWNSFGGLPENFPGNYNDVALCLKSWHKGKSVLQINSIVLTHYESLSRVPDRTDKEISDFKNFVRDFPKVGVYTLTSEEPQSNLPKNQLQLDQEFTPIESIKILGSKIYTSVRYRGFIKATLNFLTKRS